MQQTAKKKYRKWSEELTSGAIKAVMDGKMGEIGQQISMSGVPRSTLKDRVSAVHGASALFVLRRGGRASDLFSQVCGNWLPQD